MTPDGIANPSRIVRFDAESALEEIRRVAGDDLRMVVEYDHADYNVLHAAPRVIEEYGGEKPLLARVHRLHRFVSMDIIEQLLFEEAGFEFGGVGAEVTYMDHANFVRYFADDQALLVTVEPESSGERIVEALADVVEDSG